MIRIVVFIAAFLFLLQQNSERILWNPDKKLEWSDFQGVAPNDTGLAKAGTASQIVITSDLYYEDEIPRYYVKNCFDKSKSWTKTKSEKTLAHEQLHFDISELYARKIRKEFNKLYNDSTADVSIYKKIYRTLNDEEIAFQKQYDSEVYFDDKKQQEWQKCIAKELEELKEYEYVPEE